MLRAPLVHFPGLAITLSYQAGFAYHSAFTPAKFASKALRSGARGKGASVASPSRGGARHVLTAQRICPGHSWHTSRWQKLAEAVHEALPTLDGSGRSVDSAPSRPAFATPLPWARDAEQLSDDALKESTTLECKDAGGDRHADGQGDHPGTSCVDLTPYWNPWSFHSMASSWPRWVVPLLLSAATADDRMEHSDAFESITDPLALHDPFERMTEAELASLWSDDDGHALEEKVRSLAVLDDQSMVEVRLVGFDGNGHLGVKLRPEDVMHQLDLLPSSFDIHVGEGQDAHPLRVRRQLLFHVTHAPTAVARRLSMAIESHVSADQRPAVPAGTVERILTPDFHATSLSFTLYILNPSPPVDSGGNRMPYAYARDEGRACPGVASVTSERFAWIDLTAVPPRAGPATSGAGAVDLRTLPDVRSPAEDLVVRIGALVHRTSSLLLAGPMVRPAAAPSNLLRVQLVRIAAPGPWTKADKQEALRRSTVSIDTIRAQLVGLVVEGENVEVEMATLGPGDCAECDSALALARRARLRRGAPESTEAYLDSAELGEWARRIGPLAAARAFGNTTRTTNGGRHRRMEHLVTALVFVFPGSSPVLLDRSTLSVAVDSHTVVAIALPDANSLSLDFTCGDEGVAIAQPGDATRPLLGAVLQAVWGVGAFHESWDPHRGERVPWYLWASGPTPFGPFSEALELGTVHADAARRGRVHTLLDAAMRRVSQLASRLDPIGVHLDDALTAQEHLTFVRRWNVFLHKARAASKCVQP